MRSPTAPPPTDSRPAAPDPAARHGHASCCLLCFLCAALEDGDRPGRRPAAPAEP
ncbi:MAG TPA: hypothetical protein VIL48_10835 [Acidimicrobiales bacterium]